MPQILLIDDDSLTTGSNRVALQAAGHAVSVATTAPDGLAAAASQAPDVVVLEAMLDDATFSLCRALGQRLPHAQLLVLTRLDEHLTAAARAAQDHDDGWIPADLYLQKPIEPALLVELVGHALQGGH
jgi:DNA-binding response OmpR family regulator